MVVGCRCVLSVPECRLQLKPDVKIDLLRGTCVCVGFPVPTRPQPDERDGPGSYQTVIVYILGNIKYLLYIFYYYYKLYLYIYNIVIAIII